MTDTVTPVTLPKINFTDLEKALESAATFLPIIATFVPQLSPVIAFLPLIEGGLKMLADVQSKWGDPAAVVDAVSRHLHDIANQVQTVKAHAVAAGSPSPAQVAINFQASTGG